MAVPGEAAHGAQKPIYKARRRGGGLMARGAWRRGRGVNQLRECFRCVATEREGPRHCWRSMRSECSTGAFREGVVFILIRGAGIWCLRSSRHPLP